MLFHGLFVVVGVGVFFFLSLLGNACIMLDVQYVTVYLYTSHGH